MDKDNQPKTHVEQLEEPKAAKAANENPSIQREKVLNPMDPASTSVKSEGDIPKKEVKQRLGSGKENASKTHAEKEIERKASKSQDKGAARGGRGGGFKLPGQFINAPNKLDQLINLDPYDDNKPLSLNEEQGTQVENSTKELVFDFNNNSQDYQSNEIDQTEPTTTSNQLLIGELTSTSQEEFQNSLNDISSQDYGQNDPGQIDNSLTQEDFSNTVSDLTFNDVGMEEASDNVIDEDKESLDDIWNDSNSVSSWDNENEKDEYFDIDKSATEDFNVSEASINGMDDMDIGENGGTDMDMDI